jgi:hypothetical protein
MVNSEVDGVANEPALHLMPVTVSAESVQFFAEGENECTSERVRGQFSIFGAIEENPRKEVSGIRGTNELGEDRLLRRVGGGGSVEHEVRAETFGRVGGRVVHRRCTGNAERRWAGISD